MDEESFFWLLELLLDEESFFLSEDLELCLATSLLFSDEVDFSEASADTVSFCFLESLFSSEAVTSNSDSSIISSDVVAPVSDSFVESSSKFELSSIL